MQNENEAKSDASQQHSTLNNTTISQPETTEGFDSKNTIQDTANTQISKPTETKIQVDTEMPKQESTTEKCISNNNGEEEEKKKHPILEDENENLRQENSEKNEQTVQHQEEEKIAHEFDEKMTISTPSTQGKKIRRCPKPQPQVQNAELLELKIKQRLGDGKIDKPEIKIACWNVNGLRARLKNGTLTDYLTKHNLDIFCINETKLNAEWIADETNHGNFSSDYHIFFNSKRNGYSGTGILSKYKPISVKYDLGVPEHDQEGRVITAEFETFYLVVVYTPYSGEGLKKLDYRTKEWDPAFRAHVTSLKEKKHVIVLGDLNVAHEEIDLFNPVKATEEKIPGYTEEERSSFCALLREGFVDTFRYLHPTERKYTAWDQRIKEAREKKKGWRLDYILTSQEFLPAVKSSEIMDEVVGSDHCPVQIIFDPNYKGN